jgi:hypothetical protein|tara:strand:- start:1164 stop:1649 length:486 start_codon:yes stop_codon:yes gene_type:complete
MKQINADGGLAVLAGKYFENVEADDDGSFIGSHDIMTSIKGSFSDSGALIIDVKNSPPNFDDPEAMKIAQESRKKWTQFLDAATGYNSKQRGDKAKEWAKKSSKAKSAVSSARHYMKMSKTVSEEKKSQAQALIAEIEIALEEGENTKAAGRGEKLNKLFK